MSADASNDPLAMADELFAALGGPSLASPEQGLLGIIAPDLETPAGKVYTAELVVKHRPLQARRALFLLANNWGLNRTAKATGLGTHTVIALRDKFPEMVATARERLAVMCDNAAALQVERLIENPEAVKIDNAAMTAKLLRDTSAQLRGDAPPPQRHIHSHLTAEDLREMAAEMGLAAGEISALPATAHGAAAARGGDTLSLGCICINSEVTTKAQESPTTGGEGGAPTPQGGGSIDASSGS